MRPTRSSVSKENSARSSKATWPKESWACWRVIKDMGHYHKPYFWSIARTVKTDVYWQASLHTSQLNDALIARGYKDKKFFELILKNPKFDVYCKASLITAKIIR